jgi:hypothetical protein
MGQLVRRLDEIGYLRPDLTAQHGADLVFALFSHETYLALTRDANWPIEQYKAWLWATCGPSSPAKPRQRPTR